MNFAANLDIPVEDTFESIANRAGDALNAYETNFDSAVNFANLDTSALRTNLDGVSIGGFDDYNPPEVPASP